MGDFLLGLRLDLSGISSPDQADLESVLGGIFAKSVRFSDAVAYETAWILPWVDPLQCHSVSHIVPHFCQIYTSGPANITALNLVGFALQILQEPVERKNST